MNTTFAPMNAAMPKADLSQQQEQIAAMAKNKKNVHQAAVKFESMFMNEMFSHMFEGLDTNGPFSGGHGEEVFRSLMVEQYGQLVANSGQTGISKNIEKEMLRMQEEQKDPRGTMNHSKLTAQMNQISKIS